MVRVLSIQSDVLGHKTYCNLLRSEFVPFHDVDLTSCWYREGRAFSSRVIQRLAEVHVPALDGNRDYRRLRVEWSQSRMARLLIDRQLQNSRYNLLHIHTQAQALRSVDVMKRMPTVISADMTTHQAAREVTVRYPATFIPSIASERRVFQAAAHVVTWSEWARQSVVEEHGIPEAATTAILPGVRLQAMREPVFMEKEKPRILFMGRDFARKGGRDLLEVFSTHFVGRATLEIATDYSLGNYLEGVTTYRAIQAYSEPWHDLFQRADIFVMVSYAEAFGLVFQEAGAYGLALIGSNVGGIPEMISHGENGFLVRPGDRAALREHLELLISDRELLAKLRKQSYEIAKNRFDAQANFRKLANLFKMVGT